MSDELSTAEKIVEEVLTDLMTERVMSERSMSASIQASSMRGVQASPSTAHEAGSSQPSTENITKHRDDLEKVKLILSILPDYISPLVDMMSRDSVTRYFEYSMITSYLPKGTHVVCTQQDKIVALKFIDLNLGDRKNYSMLTP
jgi:hypothetical protein